MQLIGIVLLYLVVLSGSGDIIGKKCALTTFRKRQRSRLCQKGKSGIEITSLNAHSSGFHSGTIFWGFYDYPSKYLQKIYVISMGYGRLGRLPISQVRAKRVSFYVTGAVGRGISRKACCVKAT